MAKQTKKSIKKVEAKKELGFAGQMLSESARGALEFPRMIGSTVKAGFSFLKDDKPKSK